MNPKILQLVQSISEKLSKLSDAGLSMQAKLTLAEVQNDCNELIKIVNPVEKENRVTQSKKKILVVDDDHDTQKLLRYILTKKGFEVISELDPAIGINRITEVDLDIILLDIMMPNMTGFEFLNRIKQHPMRPNFKVLVGSSRSYDRDRLAVLEAGANDFIAKPYNLAELAIKLNNLAS